MAKIPTTSNLIKQQAKHLIKNVIRTSYNLLMFERTKPHQNPIKLLIKPIVCYYV